MKPAWVFSSMRNSQTPPVFCTRATQFTTYTLYYSIFFFLHFDTIDAQNVSFSRLLCLNFASRPCTSSNCCDTSISLPGITDKTVVKVTFGLYVPLSFQITFQLLSLLTVWLALPTPSGLTPPPLNRDRKASSAPRKSSFTVDTHTHIHTKPCQLTSPLIVLHTWTDANFFHFSSYRLCFHWHFSSFQFFHFI